MSNFYSIQVFFTILHLHLLQVFNFNVHFEGILLLFYSLVLIHLLKRLLHAIAVLDIGVVNHPFHLSYPIHQVFTANHVVVKLIYDANGVDG